MDKKLKWIYPLLLVILTISCADVNSTGNEIIPRRTTVRSGSDSLLFRSGISAIFQDSKGNYWFGSKEEGVCYYDGKLFRYLTTNEGLPGNQIHSIQEGENGIIWIDTPNGVCSYNGKIIRNHIGYNHLERAWEQPHTDLWFSAGTEQGVCTYDGMKLNYLAFPDPLPAHSGNTYVVSCFAKGKYHRQWIGTYAGVFGYDGKELTILNDETLGLKGVNDRLHVRSILEDSKGRLWIGNNGIGVVLIDGDSVIHFSKEQGKLIPMNEFQANGQKQEFAKNTGLQSVFAIEEDSEGNIWFGDRDTGAWKYDGQTLTNYLVDATLDTPMIWDIYKDNTGNLLFGMAGGGVYRFNGESFERY